MTNLTLVPYAGLCNRMNAILCAIAIGKEIDLETTVYWMVDKDCYAEFGELFCPISGIKVKKLTSFFLRPGRRSNFYLPTIVRSLFFEKNHNGNKTTYVDILELIKSCSNIYISSFNRFSTQEIVSSVGSYFKPIDKLQLEIDKTVSLFSKETIGIHIRRTDNVKAIEESPIHRFEQYMEEKLSSNPECMFYLASDDDNVKSHFISKFGENIISRHNVLDRTSKEGMREAVIDLFCLANTCLIVGSAKSTYSMMASYIFNKPLYICR